MKRVALTYCGGCDPAYDRVEYARRIQAAAAGRLEWVGPEAGGADCVLIVCGCERACAVADLRLGGDVQLVSVTHGRLPPEEIVTELMRKGCSHD